MSWAGWAADEASGIHAAGQWRRPRDLDAAGTEGKLVDDGRPVVSFASNDYLGLTQHPAVVAAAHAALDRWGTGSGSARLIVGSRPVHSELEVALAAWKGEERAVLFPTGFAANLGVLTTFAGAGGSSAATSSTTRRSSTGAGWPGRRGGVPTPRRRARRRRCSHRGGADAASW